jgi:hypothetical protein
VTSTEWADYSITADIAEDAQVLNSGLMTFGGATAWWDNVRLEVVGEYLVVKEPPRGLDESGLNNLVAFTRIRLRFPNRDKNRYVFLRKPRPIGPWTTLRTLPGQHDHRISSNFWNQERDHGAFLGAFQHC